MNSGSEKKLSMDELMALNRPEPSPQPTAQESSSPITPIVIQCPLPEALTMLTQKIESIGWEVRGMREYLPNLRSHTDLTAVQNSMAEIQKSLTEMTALLEQAGKKKEKRSCKWLDWLADFDLIVGAKGMVLVVLILCEHHGYASHQPDDRTDVFGFLFCLDTAVTFLGIFVTIIQ